MPPRPLECGGLCDGPLGVVDGGGLEVEVVGGGGGGGGGGDAQDSEMLTIGSFTGSEIDDNGVPAGTLTVKVSFCPPTTVTVIVQTSAEAVGKAAIADPASTVPAVATATSSLRLLNTVVYLLPPCCVRISSLP